MKIVFLCSCLEPGRDGVGDYTRRLAAELNRRGNQCRLVATHDRYVKTWTEERQPLGVLRMPQPVNVKRIRDWLAAEGFGPKEALVSYQFVSFYPYHPKGFPLRSRIKFLPELLAGYPLQIMAHELWLDFKTQPLWKRKLLGLWQRQAAKRILTGLKPLAVHTTMPVYAQRLTDCGLQANVLPLPGNIPVIPPNGWATKTLNLAQGQFVAVVFGAVHGNWEPADFLNWLVDWLKAQNKQLRLVFVGRHGPLAPGKISAIQNSLGNKIEITLLEEQPPENISDLLLEADIGISTNPWGGNGKSGTVAAMLEHGLPVVVTTPSVGDEIRDSLLLPDGAGLRQNFAAIKKQPVTMARHPLQLVIEHLEQIRKI